MYNIPSSERGINVTGASNSQVRKQVSQSTCNHMEEGSGFKLLESGIKFKRTIDPQTKKKINKYRDHGASREMKLLRIDGVEMGHWS